MAAPAPSLPRATAAPWLVGAAAAIALAGVAALAAAAEHAPAAALTATACMMVLALLGALAARRRAAPSVFQLATLESVPPGTLYAEAMEALPDPVLVVSAVERDDLTSRRYVAANQAARRLLRLERGEGLLVSAVRDPEVLDAADAALFDRRPAERIYTIPGAQERTLLVMARPIGEPEPEPDAARMAILLFRDETELRQVEKARADFLANASHELRTPLASLSGFIETLRGHAREDASARDRFLGIMQAQAERMSRLIEDLMSLSRIELNEYAHPVDVIDLKVAAVDVLDALGPLAAERGVRMETEFPDQPALIFGDRDQVIQVIQNLTDNALKYSSPGQAIHLSVAAGLSADAAAAGFRPEAARFALLSPDEAAPSYAVVRVGDEGPGMERTHLPRLTERFYRIEGQKSGPRSGTGLGLAIVKHIANRHRGGLVVESAPGRGAGFTVYFPQAPRRDARRPSQSGGDAMKLS